MRYDIAEVDFILGAKWLLSYENNTISCFWKLALRERLCKGTIANKFEIKLKKIVKGNQEDCVERGMQLCWLNFFGELRELNEKY